MPLFFPWSSLRSRVAPTSSPDSPVDKERKYETLLVRLGLIKSNANIDYWRSAGIEREATKAYVAAAYEVLGLLSTGLDLNFIINMTYLFYSFMFQLFESLSSILYQ